MNNFVPIALCAATLGCGSAEEGGTATVRQATIASSKQPCTGVADQLCLQIKRSADAAWENLYTGVDDFDYRWGYEYDLVVQETRVANPPAGASAVDTRLVSLLQAREDPAGTEYLLENVRLGAGALTTDSAAGYRLYGEPFVRAAGADCATLMSLTGSNNTVALRFRYTGDTQISLQLIHWQ